METGSPIIEKIKELRNAAKLAEEKEWEEILSKFDPSEIVKKSVSFIIEEIFKVCVKEDSVSVNIEKLIDVDKNFKELQKYSKINKNRFIELCLKNITTAISRTDPLLEITTKFDMIYLATITTFRWKIIN